MNRYLWLAVTPDKYELPICVCETREELAKKINIKAESISTAIYKKYDGRKSGMKFLKIEI